MQDWPDFNLLARWWVNGNAILPERSRGNSGSGNRASRWVHQYDEESVAGVARVIRAPQVPSDNVGISNPLYTPDLYEDLPQESADGRCMKAMGRPATCPIPMLSDRLEFAVTAKCWPIATTDECRTIGGSAG